MAFSGGDEGDGTPQHRAGEDAGPFSAHSKKENVKFSNIALGRCF
jgi:hypothetical protein